MFADFDQFLRDIMEHMVFRFKEKLGVFVFV